MCSHGSDCSSGLNCFLRTGVWIDFHFLPGSWITLTRSEGETGDIDNIIHFCCCYCWMGTLSYLSMIVVSPICVGNMTVSVSSLIVCGWWNSGRIQFLKIQVVCLQLRQSGDSVAHCWYERSFKLMAHSSWENGYLEGSGFIRVAIVDTDGVFEGFLQNFLGVGSFQC